MREIVAGRRERRARHRDRDRQREEVAAQDGPDIDRGARERDRRTLRAVRGLAAIDPVDAALEPLRQEELGLRGEVHDALGRAPEVELQRFVDRALAQQLEARREVAEHGRELVRKRVGRRDAAARMDRAAPRLADAPDAVEEAFRDRLRVEAGLRRRIDLVDRQPRRLDPGERAAARRCVVEGAQHMPNAVLAETDAEVAARDILEVMRLVEDHMVVGGQEAGALRAEREVAEEEGVVADEEIRVLHAPARRLVEALVVGRAAAAHAVAGVALDMLPHAAARQLRQRRERPVGRLVGPVLDEVERVLLLLAVADLRLLLAGDAHAPQRHIVPAALAEDGGELVGDHRLEERHILVEDLLLERDRVRADDDPLAALEDAADRGHEVGEALADAGTRLDEKAPLRLEVRLDRVGHAQLLGPRLEAADPASKRALWPEEVGGNEDGHRPRG